MRTYHPGCKGPSDGYAYRADGVYSQGLFVGLCGTAASYYLMCQQCRARYLVDKEIKASRTGAHKSSSDVPYAKLLQLAPDLLGSTDLLVDRGQCPSPASLWS